MNTVQAQLGQDEVLPHLSDHWTLLVLGEVKLTLVSPVPVA